jgi:hypothetical protein
VIEALRSRDRDLAHAIVSLVSEPNGHVRRRSADRISFGGRKSGPEQNFTTAANLSYAVPTLARFCTDCAFAQTNSPNLIDGLSKILKNA